VYFQTDREGRKKWGVGEKRIDSERRRCSAGGALRKKGVKREGGPSEPSQVHRSGKDERETTRRKGEIM
jgi:hypothetical protein